MKVFTSMKEFQVTKAMPIDVNSTFITLIPKVSRDNDFSKYRPIILCNVLYKIVSKSLANRLKCILPFIISSHQGGFVSGH